MIIYKLLYIKISLLENIIHFDVMNYNKYNFCKRIIVCIKLEIEKLIFTCDINSNQKLNFLKVKKIYIQ